MVTERRHIRNQKDGKNVFSWNFKKSPYGIDKMDFWVTDETSRRKKDRTQRDENEDMRSSSKRYSSRRHIRRSRRTKRKSQSRRRRSSPSRRRTRYGRYRASSPVPPELLSLISTHLEPGSDQRQTLQVEALHDVEDQRRADHARRLNEQRERENAEERERVQRHGQAMSIVTRLYNGEEVTDALNVLSPEQYKRISQTVNEWRMKEKEMKDKNATADEEQRKNHADALRRAEMERLERVRRYEDERRTREQQMKDQDAKEEERREAERRKLERDQDERSRQYEINRRLQERKEHRNEQILRERQKVGRLRKEYNNNRQLSKKFLKTLYPEKNDEELTELSKDLVQLLEIFDERGTAST